MITMTAADVRDFLRVDAANDVVITPILAASVKYIENAVGAENAIGTDPRCLLAVQLHCYGAFYANDVYAPAISALIAQIRCAPEVVTDGG